jgi:hypothetical protein
LRCGQPLFEEREQLALFKPDVGVERLSEVAGLRSGVFPVRRQRTSARFTKRAVLFADALTQRRPLALIR